MVLLGPVTGVTITPQRPTSDGLGNLTFADLDDIENAVFAVEPAVGGSRLHPDSVYRQSAQLFVPRGSDIRNGDRVTYQGRNWVVIGELLWDMDHPMTGEDFGYVEVPLMWGG
jgi:hypothetical protein